MTEKQTLQNDSEKQVDLEHDNQNKVDVDNNAKEHPENAVRSSSITAAKVDEILALLCTLESEFQHKLQYDKHKESIIDKLHQEVQQYKDDLLKKLLHPVITDIIHSIDDLNKLVTTHQKKPVETLDPAKLLNQMASMSEDLEHLLYKQGVEVLSELLNREGLPELTFSPTYQKASQIIPTDDPSKDKTVAQILRNGYSWEGKVIRPQHVAVYVYKKSEDDKTLTSEATTDENPILQGAKQ